MKRATPLAVALAFLAYREMVDPRNGIYESNEANNAAQRTVRLPYRAGRASHCPHAR